VESRREPASPVPVALAAFAALLLGAGSAAARTTAEDPAVPAPEPDAAAAEPGAEAGALLPAAAAGPEEPSYFYLPPLPYYQETTSRTGLRLFFPFYFEQWDDDAQEHSLGVLPFYWRWRGPDELHETDVVLGLYWRYRRPERFTDVAGPLYVSRTADGYDVGLPPLFMVGGDPESDYQVIALYFWRFAWETGVFALAPPFYYYQEGRKLRYGLPPLLFGGEDGTKGYSVFFPVFWQFYDDADGSSTTVIPPLFVDIDEEGDWSAGIAPLLFFGGGEDSSHFTLFPLVHYAHDGDSTRVITPLAWYAGDAESEGWGALLYHQWEEGPEWFQTFAPVWWAWGNEETGERNDLVLNVYHGSDPVSSDWVVFPFWWDFHDYESNRTYGFMPFFLHDTSLYEDRHTTWVFPTFQYSEWPQTGAEPPGWSFSMHPLIYFGTEGDEHHEVVFPLWWNFSDPESRITGFAPLFWDYENYAEKSRFWTLFPLIWRSEDEEGTFTLAVNTIYTTTANQDGSEGWHFHFIPLFDVGRETPEDLDWSVLYGLFGYERRGPYERMKLFWIPINL
jgi:hypothetical protein